MMIEVLLSGNNDLEVVPDYVLGELLARGRVQGFRRLSGWVVVGRDPVRKSRKGFLAGLERRRQRGGSCLMCPEMIDGECIDTGCSKYHCAAKVFS
jgi:hypothetical protein